MGVKLVRSAYSTILREAADGSAAILDKNGLVVAQAELIPLQLGTIGETFRACARAVPPEEMEEGDFYINNSPFEGGQHLPDVYIFSPIFFQGSLVGFSASVAHHLDFGGGAPGMNPHATDIYQEGIIIPPSRYNMERDWNGGGLQRFITANVRVPEVTIGDFNAQFSANAIGGQRVKQLCHKYGMDTIQMAIQAYLNYSERRMRKSITEMLDGVYEGEDALDDDGIHDEALPVKVAVTISGDHITVDFTGSAPQVQLNLNCPFTSTSAAVLTAIKCVASSPDLAFNDGLARPVTINAPLGSIVNPQSPAPVRARSVAASRIFDAVLKAFSKVIPDRISATGFGDPYSLCLSSFNEGSYSIYIEIFGGGYGAGPHSNGCDGVSGLMSNCSNIPVEALDQKYSFFRVIEYSLRSDSGGDGAFRGGHGLCRTYELLADEISLAHYSDRYRFTSDGIFGGKPGASARGKVVRASGRTTVMGSKASLKLHKGDILVCETGGGGGYGEPLR